MHSDFWAKRGMYLMFLSAHFNVVQFRRGSDDHLSSYTYYARAYTLKYINRLMAHRGTGESWCIAWHSWHTSKMVQIRRVFVISVHGLNFCDTDISLYNTNIIYSPSSAKKKWINNSTARRASVFVQKRMLTRYKTGFQETYLSNNFTRTVRVQKLIGGN